MKAVIRSTSSSAAFGVRRSRLYRRVASFLAGWARGRTGRPRLLAACSGGPDSTALLLALWALREELPLEVHVICVDHQLRPEASQEAALVVEVASRLGLAAESLAVRCPPGPSKMATARTARYDALAVAARRLAADAVLVAHTQQDQAETMLMRWLAGAGLLGLAGMESRRDLPVPGAPGGRVDLLRPLLETSRTEVEALLAAEAALVAPLPVHDPSNFDRHYQRSRLRHELLPVLRQEQPPLDEHLAQLSAQLHADSDYLEQQADAAYRALSGRCASSGDIVTTLPVAATAGLPPALFARVIMRASGGGLGQAHIGALRGLCAHGRGSHSLDLPGGRRVERRYEELRFFAPGARQRTGVPIPPEQTLAACGTHALADGTLFLQWEPAPPSAAPATATAGYQARLVLPYTAFPLTLRAPRPGDRIRIAPGGGHRHRDRHRKISDLLIDLKVPRFERAAVRLLCWGSQILWVVGHRFAAPPSLPPGSAAAPLGTLLARFEPAERGPGSG